MMNAPNGPASTTVIGLEVHVQLATQTKLFCRCSTQFGAPSNTQTCPVCLGLPGALPVMNRQAYLLALRTAVALNCHIPPLTKWDRKQYFYPDLPKGYQISQYDLPMSERGHLAIGDDEGPVAPKEIRIIRAHLEEDAGKSMHDEAAGRHDSRVDLNRAGTPLLEIVSAPDLRSPAEAKAFLNELKLLLQYLEVSDCNMQEGSLRVDANINLHLETSQGVVATPIVEVKNMNSFRAVERALAFEADRQFQAWQETGQQQGDVPKQTRSWDDQGSVTRAMRSKEESSDYRYFPDPDLVPVTHDPAVIEQVRREIGELPADLRRRICRDYDVSYNDADVLVSQGRGIAEYFLVVAEASGDARQASNWVQRDVLRTIKELKCPIDEFPITAKELAALLVNVKQGKLDRSRAPDVFAHLVQQGGTVADAMGALGIERIDDSLLDDLCRALLAANPKIIADVQAGNTKALGALIGQAKKLNPNVDPNRLRERCLALIAARTSSS
jgi:aspartyl-tRNA(Asn)/glutamyl-tRNA(Gln) amidotransferase subunit B